MPKFQRNFIAWQTPYPKDHPLFKSVEDYMQSVTYSNVIARLKEAQHKNEICRKVYGCVQDRWPAYKTDIHWSIQQYWQVQSMPKRKILYNL